MRIKIKDISLFESHFHVVPDISFSEYSQESRDAGVKYLLAVGSSFESTLLSEKFAENCDRSWFSTGAHPHEAAQFIGNVDDFAKFAKNRKCVAVGEIGLDYFYEFSEREKQLRVFKDFLKLALDFSLPAIIHCRDKDTSEQAYIDTFLLLRQFAADGGRFVVHCYTGTTEWAKKFLDLGGYLGITGIVTFPKAQNVRDVLKIIPENRLLIETDTPYLAPVPKRGKTNHSKYLTYIAERIADEKSISIDDVAKMTTDNAKKFFNV